MKPGLRRFAWVLVAVLSTLSLTSVFAQSEVKHEFLIRDLAEVEGVRDNALIGYGIVVGLHGTGDRQQTYFTTQTLANTLQRMGLQINPAVVMVKNVAAVFVTATLPPFAIPGTRIDLTVSSIGDAKSLEGGVLLLTSLRGPDGQTYASGQGALTLGGYSAGTGGNLKTVNHTTVGMVPAGGIVERDTSVDLSRLQQVFFGLRQSDFRAANDVAAAINQSFGNNVAVALDGRRIAIDVPRAGAVSVASLITRIQNLSVEVHPPAKVVVNERTGTIVMGGDVKLTPVSIMQGSLSIEISTQYVVSQPEPFSNGRTTTVPETTVNAQSDTARSIHLGNGASVEQLINGLHAIGATAQDIVAILQAIRAAGGLQAELEVM